MCNVRLLRGDCLSHGVDLTEQGRGRCSCRCILLCIDWFLSVTTAIIAVAVVSGAPPRQQQRIGGGEGPVQTVHTAAGL